MYVVLVPTVNFSAPFPCIQNKSVYIEYESDATRGLQY